MPKRYLTVRVDRDEFELLELQLHQALRDGGSNRKLSRNAVATWAVSRCLFDIEGREGPPPMPGVPIAEGDLAEIARSLGLSAETGEELSDLGSVASARQAPMEQLSRDIIEAWHAPMKQLSQSIMESLTAPMEQLSRDIMESLAAPMEQLSRDIIEAWHAPMKQLSQSISQITENANEANAASTSTGAVITNPDRR